MADKLIPIESTGVFMNDFGAPEYHLNGHKVSREDFMAVTLARIAGALERQTFLMEVEEGEAIPDPGEPDAGEPSTNDLFGMGPSKG